jgi:hypothetical protein
MGHHNPGVINIPLQMYSATPLCEYLKLSESINESSSTLVELVTISDVPGREVERSWSV